MSSPLFHTAAVRAMLMESLAKAESPSDRTYHDQAFMVGILSLLDVLLDADMSHLLEELSVSEEVKTALRSGRGPAGRLLRLVKSKEDSDQAAVQEALSELSGISLSTLMEAELAAVAWADSVAKS